MQSFHTVTHRLERSGKVPHVADERCVPQQSVERDTQRKLEEGNEIGEGNDGEMD